MRALLLPLWLPLPLPPPPILVLPTTVAVVGAETIYHLTATARECIGRHNSLLILLHTNRLHHTRPPLSALLAPLALLALLAPAALAAPAGLLALLAPAALTLLAPLALPAVAASVAAVVVALGTAVVSVIERCTLCPLVHSGAVHLQLTLQTVCVHLEETF
jgi:hypothetical protein